MLSQGKTNVKRRERASFKLVKTFAIKSDTFFSEKSFSICKKLGMCVCFKRDYSSEELETLLPLRIFLFIHVMSFKEEIRKNDMFLKYLWGKNIGILRKYFEITSIVWEIFDYKYCYLKVKEIIFSYAWHNCFKVLFLGRIKYVK